MPWGPQSSDKTRDWAGPLPSACGRQGGSQRGPGWEGRGVGKTGQAEEEGSAAGWAGGRAAGGALALTQGSWKFTWSQASGPRVSGPHSEVLV